jgi:hypothetical protein
MVPRCSINVDDAKVLPNCLIHFSMLHEVHDCVGVTLFLRFDDLCSVS